MNKVLETYLKAERGRLTKLSNALGLTPSAIKQWVVIPAERMADVSRLTGIPMDELRPDIFEIGLMAKRRKARQIEVAA